MRFRNFLMVAAAVVPLAALAQKKMKTIVLTGEYRVDYPTRTESLEISVIDLESQQPVAPERDGNYVLQSQRNKNYEIRFQVSNRKITGDIVIVNFRPGDSTIIAHEDLQFRSSKTFQNKKIQKEQVYRGDSILTYVNRYDGGQYEGSLKLTPRGFRNLGYKEFDDKLLLKLHTYPQDGIWYHDYYQFNVLIRRKFIKDGQNTVLLLTDENANTRLIYKRTEDGKYGIDVYDAQGKLVGTQPVTQEDYEREFPPITSIVE